MGKSVYRTKFELDLPATVNGYAPDPDEKPENKYGIQIDHTPGGGRSSVMTYMSPAQARVFAAELVKAADAVDEAVRAANACANCEGAGCNNCLPEPHDPESEPAPEVG